MQYVYTKHTGSKTCLTCVNHQNPKSIDVITRDLVTNADIKFIEKELSAKFLRAVGEVHYLFRKY